MHRLVSYLTLLWICAACTVSPEIVRAVEEGDHGRVEVAWIELTPPAGRPSVSLINMVHVGEPRYFADVQSRLDSAALVLMEGVVRESAPEGVTSGSPRRVGADLFDLATTFRLVHQLDALQWRPHFRNADMGETEFRTMPRRTTTREAPSLRDLQRDANFAVYRFRRRNPQINPDTAEEHARRGVARRVLARQIASGSCDARLRPVVGQIRYRIALRALDETKVVGRVVLCWGFAHGEDFVRALRNRGYRVASVAWHEVFRY